jgi:hypothetical protein
MVMISTKSLSGVEGLEPPNGGTKNRSLTTWPHPINFKYIITYSLNNCQILTHQLEKILKKKKK